MSTLFFITSNRAKLAHARHLALRYDVAIRGQNYYGIAYREPRSLNRTELLEKSYEDARERWLKTTGNLNALFFIEDTSLIIHALSESNEYPGVDVKYWMQDISFSELDAQLRNKSNDRSVTVRSDVLLHLPKAYCKVLGVKSPVHFIGNTSGTITTVEKPLDTNLLHPWLDNRTFNKWFVPKGCKRPISALPIEIADQHDIRKDSIGAMLRFLSVQKVIGDYFERQHFPVSQSLPHLFPPLLVVTGLPCAGKTSLGEFLSSKCGYYHIEASDFMRRAFYERHGMSSSLSVEAFAEVALQRTPDIVVRPVLEEIHRSRAELAVVTGFRSPKEIEIFRREYRGPAELACWFIEAEQGIRFRRSGARGRPDAAESISTFQKTDNTQLRMGLKTIRELLHDNTVVNESTMRRYLQHCAHKLGLKPSRFVWPPIRELHKRPTSLEEAVLIGLAVHRRSTQSALSTTQIAHRLNEIFADSALETSKNNVSRYFNFKPHPFFRSKKIDGVQKYSLSATGLSRALRLVSSRWLKRHKHMDHKGPRVRKQIRKALTTKTRHRNAAQRSSRRLMKTSKRTARQEGK